MSQPFARYDVDKVRAAAKPHWLEILNRVAGIDDDFLSPRHGPCPFCPDRGKDRFRLFDDQSGGGICAQPTCGARPDGFAMIMDARGIGFPQALEEVAVFLGVQPEPPRNGQTAKKKADPTENLKPLEFSEQLVSILCLRKRPLSLEGILSLNGYLARYFSNTVIAIPVLDKSLDIAKPVGNWIINATGGELPHFVKGSDGKSERQGTKKHKLTVGSKSGFIASKALLDAFSRGRDLSSETVFMVEGPVDLAALVSLAPDTYAFTNANGAGETPRQPVIDLLVKCRVKRVRLIFDCDTAGQQGATGKAKKNGSVSPGWGNAIRARIDDTRNVRLPYEVTKSEGKDLRDWLNDGGSIAELDKLPAEDVQPIAISPDRKEDEDDTRARIVITDNERRTVDQTIEALKNDPTLYTMGGKLVDVIELPHPDDHEQMVPQVRSPKPLLDLRADITALAFFVRETEDGDQRKPIPQPLAGQVAVAGRYPGIRPLDGFSEHAFLRPDGSVCTASGYDVKTRTLVRTNLEVDVQEHPSREDALEAVGRLLDLVSDFPFKAGYHRSAWLAALLTMFARPAIKGPVPLMLFEASRQGSGKTRLVDVITHIATGRGMVRSSWPGKDEEVEKRVTTFVLAGLPVVLFDNARKPLGGGAMEAVSTSTTWKSRILGESRETAELPMRTIFFFTSNNASMTLDFARRSCVCRLEPSDESPDERTGFAKPDLLGYILEHRAQFASDALTILRAFWVSGEYRSKSAKQDSTGSESKSWGSFERWSDLVRAAILWLDLDDPMQSMLDAKRAEEAEDVFPALLAALVECGVGEHGQTAGSIRKLSENSTNLDDAISSAVGDKRATSIRLGKVFHRYEGRIFDGKQFFSSYDSHKKQKLWCIRHLSAGNAGSCGESRGPSEYQGEVEGASGNTYMSKECHNSPQTPASPAAGDSAIPNSVNRVLSSGLEISIGGNGQLFFIDPNGQPSNGDVSADDRRVIADWLQTAPKCDACGAYEPSAIPGSDAIYCRKCSTRLTECHVRGHTAVIN